ncbi:phospholipid scramblase family protein [Anatilimnocola floriformis]|uniref:phospholipid scramblase family protein n=1 Tax=Anatilimnocola floriformis TaxID=2948575 RepID=UPI0020C22FE0|nr:phospholipid scramblase family protein [Anatilimnocola floriformis]
MHPVLNRNLFFVKEHAGMFKAASNYDILDPSTNQIIMNCREERLGFITKMLRFTKHKNKTPFDIQIRTPDGTPVLSVKRGVTFFLSKVDVLNETQQRVGGFQQKLFSIGGAFTVLGSNDQPVCELKGKWTGWEFTFMSGNTELAKVSKKWAGLGKELFTSADNYILQISDQVPFDNPVRMLIVGAVMCIDLVLKE